MILVAESLHNFLMENIILPLDFKTYINKIKDKRFNNLDSINNMFKDIDVVFSDYSFFYDNLGSDEEKKVAPKNDNRKSESGFKFALYNQNIDKINIVVNSKEFLEYLNDLCNSSQKEKEHFYNFLEQVLRHESIHLQQAKKMGDKYNLLSSPTDPQKYFSDQKEIMAYARSLIDDLINNGYTKEEIKDGLRNKKQLDTWIHMVYKKYVDIKKYRTFLKYAYLYLETDLSDKKI